MKNTEELLHQIRNSGSGDLSFLEGSDFNCPSIEIYVCGLLAQRGLEGSYGYQIFNGTRRPTRNILIRLAFLLGLDLDETNRLLKIGHKEVLYPRVRYDAAVICAIERRLSLRQLDVLLEEAAV